MISDTAKMWLQMFGLDPAILEAATSDTFQKQIGALMYCIQHTHALAVEQQQRIERIEAMLEDMLAERTGLNAHDDESRNRRVTALLAAGPAPGTGGHGAANPPSHAGNGRDQDAAGDARIRHADTGHAARDAAGGIA